MPGLSSMSSTRLMSGTMEWSTASAASLFESIMGVTLRLANDPAQRKEAVTSLLDFAPRREVITAVCEMALELLQRRQDQGVVKSFSALRSSAGEYLVHVEPCGDPTPSDGAAGSSHLNEQSLADAPMNAGASGLGDMDHSLVTLRHHQHDAALSHSVNTPAASLPLPLHSIVTLPSRSAAAPAAPLAEFANHSVVSWAGSGSSHGHNPSTPSGESPQARRLLSAAGADLSPTTPHLQDSVITTMSRSAVVVTRGDTLDSVNDLEFVRPIGHGAQATVWLCVDVNTGEERAVKVIDRSHCGVSDADGASLMEIEAAKRLRHDNVIRLYEVIDDPSARAVFLVMEYVEHGHSGAVHAETGACDTTLTMSDIGQLAVGAAQGVHYFHARGVLHGDIKPENLLIDRQPGDTLRCVVADFGVSKLCAPLEFDPDAPLVPTVDIMLSSAEQLEAFIEMLDARRAVSAPSDVPFLTSSELGGSATASGPHRDPMPSLNLSQAASHLNPARVSPRTNGSQPQQPSGPRSMTGSMSPRASPGMLGMKGLDFAASVSTSGTGSGPQNRTLLQLLLEAPNNRSDPAASTSMETNASRSLRDVGTMLADKTRELQRLTSVDSRARNLTKRLMFGGTPAFQAPELFEGGQPTPASDMWALGVTLYALIFKRLPWHGATWSELKAAVCGTALTFPVETVCDREQRRWRAIIERLLHKDPRARMTAAELCRASLAASRSGTASMSPTHHQSPRHMSRLDSSWSESPP